MKLIDAEKLAERFVSKQYYSAEAITEKIKTAEVIDALKIVRCEDCRHWNPENAEEGDTSGHCRNNYCACQNQQTDMMWFCADGEKV